MNRPVEHRRVTGMSESETTAGNPGARAKISVQRYFEISLLLMLATSFVTLASTGKLDTFSLVLFSGALGAKLWSYARGERGYVIESDAVNRIAIAYVLFYPVDLFLLANGPSFMDRVLTATIHLVLFTTIIKIFSARRYRDYLYLALLSFLTMLASAILTVGTAYLVGLSLYVLLSISMFISFEIKQGIDHADHFPAGPYRTPRENRVAVENSLFGATLGLAFAIAVFTPALFFMIPRYHAAYLNDLGIQAQNVTGFTESVQLGDLGAVMKSNRVVMRVRVDGNPHRYEGIKWRGVGFTSFNGRRWYDDDTSQTIVQSVGDGRFLIPPQEGQRKRPLRDLRYHILLSAISSDVIFAAATPLKISGRLRALTVDQTNSLHNPQHGYSAFEYEAVSDIGLPAAQRLREDSSPIPPELLRRETELPHINPAIGELARQITRADSNNYDRALAIQDYLRSHYGYTLDPRGIEPSDPIGSFLFTARQGYCEYFASAMAIMLRTRGVPARIVNGFQTGSYNPVGGDFVVRARDAHSWVEVYFPDYGWMAFDPTPADPNAEEGALSTLSDYLDAFSLFWNEWVINYDFAHQVHLAQQIDEDSHDYRWRLEARWRQLKAQGTRWAAGTGQGLMEHKGTTLVVVLALIIAFRLSQSSPDFDVLRLAWLRRTGDRTGRTNAKDATLVYQQFLKAMRKRGFLKSAGQTAWEFAETVEPGSVGPELSSAVRDLTNLYNALRFSQAVLPLAPLFDALARVKTSGKAGAIAAPHPSAK
ncbi:MAG: transglutaminase TgpA family protein [Terriglobia bacterium]